MCNRNARQPYRLHLPLSSLKCIHLYGHLTRLRRMEPALLVPSLDILLHIVRQLQRYSQALVIKPHNALWQQIRILRISHRSAGQRLAGDAWEGTPFSTEMVLGSEENGDEDFDDTLGFDAIRGSATVVFVGEVEAAG